MYKPMLAPHESPSTYPDFFKKLRYPLLCSPKLDGIRCTIKPTYEIDVHDIGGEHISLTKLDDYKCKSRTFEDIPSVHAQAMFSGYHELDGELIEGNETDHNVYNRTQSFVMSNDKYSPHLKFRVFDCALESIMHEMFIDRLNHAEKLIKEYNEQFNSNVSLIEHTLIENYEELIEYENGVLALGYEGIMMRDPEGPYKHGRGTFKQGWIYKLKRQQDDECIITDFLEEMTNENEQERSALGYSKRSSSKEGKVGADTLGKFVGEFNGQEIIIAPGHFNHAERKFIWENKESFRGKFLKFRHFPHGVKDKPRHPRAIGWRDKIDM